MRLSRTPTVPACDCQQQSVTPATAEIDVDETGHLDKALLLREKSMR